MICVRRSLQGTQGISRRSTIPVIDSRRRITNNSNDLVLINTKNQVTTITMNNPAKYNAWGRSLCSQLMDRFKQASEDPETKVIIYTGTDPYFSSGGSLAEFVVKKTPSGIQKMIREENEKMFNVFIEANKPIIAAVNGPGIGAGTTSPALCDIIIASERATFLTPFARLGVNPEGCASVHFERILGNEGARRMLVDCWCPNAEEAKVIGLVQEVVQHEQLQERAQELGEQWIKEGRERQIRGGGSVAEYKLINAKESADLSEAFVSKEFLQIQLNHLRKKGKHRTMPGLVLRVMLFCRPIWIKFL